MSCESRIRIVKVLVLDHASLDDILRFEWVGISGSLDECNNESTSGGIILRE